MTEVEVLVPPTIVRVRQQVIAVLVRAERSVNIANNDVLHANPSFSRSAFVGNVEALSAEPLNIYPTPLIP